jgi:hypothetical protein
MTIQLPLRRESGGEGRGEVGGDRIRTDSEEIASHLTRLAALGTLSPAFAAERREFGV